MFKKQNKHQSFAHIIKKKKVNKKRNEIEGTKEQYSGFFARHTLSKQTNECVIFYFFSLITKYLLQCFNIIILLLSIDILDW